MNVALGLHSSSVLIVVVQLLQYIGETSPECLENLDTPRNIPAPPMQAELEQEAMGSVVNQRFQEQDYVARSATLSM